jgi:hypothetical protein
LIWTWNKEGPKHNSYTISGFSTTVWIESPDSAMNARATFARSACGVDMWSRRTA